MKTFFIVGFLLLPVLAWSDGTMVDLQRIHDSVIEDNLGSHSDELCEDIVLENGDYYLWMYAGSNAAYLIAMFNPDQRAQIGQYLQKFLDWESKAAAKGVTLDKPIGEITSRESVFTINGTVQHFGPIKATFNFATLRGLYKLQIDFSGLDELHNPSSRVLSSTQVETFRHAISQPAVDRAIAKFKKQKSIEAEFK